MGFTIVSMGLTDYKDALAIQQKLQKTRVDSKVGDVLLLLEHNSVITLGRRGEYSNIIRPKSELEKEGVDIYETVRGGDVTYHGPGQLVGYPIIDLIKRKLNIKEFVFKIQEVFINLLKEVYNIESRREVGKNTGVWIGGEKITAIGIAVRNWVTMHGFSFNVNTNLEHFSWINPCGVAGMGVTSLEKLIGVKQEFNNVTNMVAEFFCRVFETEANVITRADLDRFIQFLDQTE